MKQKFLCVIAICLPSIIFCQTEISGNGINWSQDLTWKQVQQKAKKENKYIFVDCYATWCKPCYEMDEKVYTVDSLADFLNTEFISVKLQMDQTKNDNSAVKSWYKTAGVFAKQYNLTAYPTMLFFTPSGEIATKEVGYKEPAAFIAAARNAKIPSKQYYVLLNNYKKGKLDDAAKRSLIKTAKQLNDTTNYRALRKSYYAYLHALPKEKLYTKENIEFIAGTIGSRNHVVFDMFYPDGSAVDKVMEKNGYAKKVVDEVIMKENVGPVFNAALDAKKEPNWTDLFSSIAKSYREDYADRGVMEAKMKWYYLEGNLLKYATILNDRMEKYGTDTTSKGDDFILNNMAFILFTSINDVVELKRIISWMSGVMKRGEKQTDYYINYWPLYIDTYANLLYKVGETKEALKWQELAVTKSKELNIGKGDIQQIQENLEMMKKGEPTWPVKTN